MSTGANIKNESCLKLVMRLLILVALNSNTAYADNSEDVSSTTMSSKKWLAPPSEFYPTYIADPRRAQSALFIMGLPESEIPEAGDARSIIRLGGRFALVRFHPENHPDRGIQIDLEAGFFGQFDLIRSLDNIGWDGVYGLLLSYKPAPHIGFRVGTLHDSAHIGDEYVDETGRERIGYTREELVAGVSWSPGKMGRAYGEVAWAYEAVDARKKWRLQTGLEYHGPQRFWQNRLTWYAAADVNFFEERDWVPAATLQFGVILPTEHASSRYRVAMEAYHGRSILGELSFHDEAYVGLGLYYDL